MGTKMAPAFANLFMGKLETTLLQLGEPNILIWRRFIDDIFLIWNGTMTSFTTYIEKINQTHETIKFTHEVSDKEVTFLDVKVYKGERFKTTGILDIKTHIKLTNK